jgi:hypothetical protein
MPPGVKGFQKGRQRTGGKSKGCKHKINRDIIGLLDQLNCNPIEGLAKIANDERVDPATRAAAFSRIARFVHPELKSIEVSGKGGGAIKHEYVGDPRQALRDRVAKFASRATLEPGDRQLEPGGVSRAPVQLDGEREAEPDRANA